MKHICENCKSSIKLSDNYCGSCGAEFLNDADSYEKEGDLFLKILKKDNPNLLVTKLPRTNNNILEEYRIRIMTKDKKIYLIAEMYGDNDWRLILTKLPIDIKTELKKYTYVHNKGGNLFGKTKFNKVSEDISRVTEGL